MRRKISRGQVLKFFSGQSGCLVAMEACGSTHYWGRESADPILRRRPAPSGDYTI